MRLGLEHDDNDDDDDDDNIIILYYDGIQGQYKLIARNPLTAMRRRGVGLYGGEMAYRSSYIIA